MRQIIWEIALHCVSASFWIYLLVDMFELENGVLIAHLRLSLCHKRINQIRSSNEEHIQQYCVPGTFGSLFGGGRAVSQFPCCAALTLVHGTW